MSWYYAQGTQQVGPVPDEEIHRLVESRAIARDNLIWAAGMPDWKPYDVVWPSGSGSGGATGVASVPGLTSEQLIDRDYEHDLGGYLSRAWEIFKGDAGIIIGASVLVYVCLIGCNIVPYLGAVLSLVFTGPLMGGLWLFYLRKTRGEHVYVGDAFSGFGSRFGQMLLAHLVPALLAGLCVIPLVAIVLLMSFSSRGGTSWAMLPMYIAGGLVVLICFCAMMFLQTCWMFTLPLVADKGMQFWFAMQLSWKMVRKHWWSNFGVVIVLGLIGSIGFLLCGIGVLVSGPLAFLAMVQAYERIFAELEPTPVIS